MSYRVPLSNKTGSIFDYQGRTKFSALRWNNYMRCWLCDFSWNSVVVKSLALRAGTNMLKQYGVPFSLYVVNNNDLVVDPDIFPTVSVFIIEPGDFG